MTPHPTGPADHDGWQDLIAAGLHDPLDAGPQQDLDRHLAACPACRRHHDELQSVLGHLTAAVPAPAHLEERIVAAATRTPLRRLTDRLTSRLTSATGPATGPRTPLLTGTAVAALLLIAVVVLTGRTGGPAPGTPGAEEVVQVSGPGALGAEVAVVTHTWGTEVVLALQGFTDPRPHQVVLLTDDGPVAAGSFLGTDVTITCRMNAAVPRGSVRGIEVIDPGGAMVVSGVLPDI
jgi:hypothetical protein